MDQMRDSGGRLATIIAVLGITIALFSCLSQWLVVPQVQDYLNRRSQPVDEAGSGSRSSNDQGFTPSTKGSIPPAEIVRGEEKNLTPYVQASASSTLPPENVPVFGWVAYNPANAIDGDLTTSWVEGVSGPGINEQVTLTFPRPMVITRIGISVGFDRDDPIFWANNRVRVAQLLLPDTYASEFTFDDRRGRQFVPIPNVITSSVTIVIKDVYHGTKYDDTPIAEVEIWGYETE